MKANRKQNGVTLTESKMEWHKPQANLTVLTASKQGKHVQRFINTSTLYKQHPDVQTPYSTQALVSVVWRDYEYFYSPRMGC